MRSGVFHWGLGITLHHDPGVQTQSQKLLDFTTKYNMPGITAGTRTPTSRRTRFTCGTPIAGSRLLDKGRMMSLDNAEVRALASRYGTQTSC